MSAAHVCLGVDPCAECCEHPSATGVDTSTGPDKVWRCDVCGWLYRSVRLESGFDRLVAA